MDVAVGTVREFGGLVRRLRVEAGLSQADVASRAGVSREWVGRLERGAAGAELGRVLAVLSALGKHVMVTDRSQVVDPDGAFLDEYVTRLVTGSTEAGDKR